MFRWLTRLVWHDDFIGEIISRSGYRDRIEQHDARDKQRREEEARARLEQKRLLDEDKRERELTDPFWARVESRRKRGLLELELEDADWILNYEKRLAKLQKKTAINTERMRRLEHHLTGLRRSLD